VAAPNAWLSPLPSRPATYVLFLLLSRADRVSVGRLGTFLLPPGLYAYVGSARGPGGISSRVGRHLRHPKSMRWHIDFLRAYARPVAVWWAEGEQREECAWATALTALPQADIAVPGFGSSDCCCPAHLIWFPALPDRTTFEQQIGRRLMEVRFDE